jgi:subtilisin family serine protease
VSQPRSVIAGALIIIATLLLSGCDNAPFSSDRTSFRAAQVVVDDPLYLDGSQWYLDHVRARQAWQLVADHEVRVGALTPAPVAVIDTAVDTGHADLQRILTRDGYNFVVGQAVSVPAPSPSVDEVHGSHVAGLVGAERENAIGIAGAGYNHGGTLLTPVMPLVMLTLTGYSNGAPIFEGTIGDLAESMLYAAGLVNSSGSLPARTVRVMNLSLGVRATMLSSADRTFLGQIVQRVAERDVVIVAAAGNDGMSSIHLPALYPQVISVGSIDEDLGRSAFSNHGGDLDLVAPGARGTNGSSGYEGLLSTISEGRYGLLAGTSMAAPIVTGIAAMVRSVNPDLTAAQVRAILQETATDLGNPGRDDQFGYGLVNAEAAVEMAIRISTGSDSLLRGRVADLSPGALPDTALRSPAPWDATGSRSIAILLDPDLTDFGDGGAVAARIRELTGMEVTGAGPLLRGTVPVELDGDEVLRALYELEFVRSAVQDRLLRWR